MTRSRSSGSAVVRTSSGMASEARKVDSLRRSAAARCSSSSRRNASRKVAATDPPVGAAGSASSAGDSVSNNATYSVGVEHVCSMNAPAWSSASGSPPRCRASVSAAMRSELSMSSGWSSVACREPAPEHQLSSVALVERRDREPSGRSAASGLASRDHDVPATSASEQRCDEVAALGVVQHQHPSRVLRQPTHQRIEHSLLPVLTDRRQSKPTNHDGSIAVQRIACLGAQPQQGGVVGAVVVGVRQRDLRLANTRHAGDLHAPALDEERAERGDVVSSPREARVAWREIRQHHARRRLDARRCSVVAGGRNLQFESRILAEDLSLQTPQGRPWSRGASCSARWPRAR